jgi:hypothetical protein
MGIFGATLPNSWTYSYDDESNTLTFSGNGSYLSPGNADTFRIYSTHTHTAQGAANAVAAGSIEGTLPFPPLETRVPSEHPAAHVVRVEHAAPAGWVGVAGLGDVRINAVAMNELEVAHRAAVTVSVQRVVGHPEDSGRRLVVKGIGAEPP